MEACKYLTSAVNLLHYTTTAVYRWVTRHLEQHLPHIARGQMNSTGLLCKICKRSQLCTLGASKKCSKKTRKAHNHSPLPHTDNNAGN